MSVRFILVIFIASASFAQTDDTLKIYIPAETDSITLSQDSLSISDSSIVVRKDSIIRICSGALSDENYFLSNAEIIKLGYRYTGDFLQLFPFNFVKDLGFPGQPNETFIYGAGNSAVGFMLDGININERHENSFNLNLIQSEDIDSVEIISLPRGFFYGTLNNPVSVNFITRDFIPKKPYSRIRFYQGPNRESMIDGRFNLLLTSRLAVSFGIANRIADSTYANSEYSIWQGKINFRYMPSNKLNIIGSYSFNDYNAGYNGGVDFDSIKSISSDIDKILYDFRAAPMVYPNGELKTITNFPQLKILSEPFSWLKTNADIFYLLNKTEHNSFGREYRESETYGVSIRNDAEYGFLRFRLNLDYENTKTFRSYSFYEETGEPGMYALDKETDYDIFSFSAFLSPLISDGKIIPSVFYKFSSVNGDLNSLLLNPGSGNTGSGLGIDLKMNPLENLKFYVGYSIISRYFSDNQNYFLFETGIGYNLPFLNAEVKYFINDYKYGSYRGGIFFEYIGFGDLSGLGLNLKMNYWKLLLESGSSFYSASAGDLNGVPEYQTQTGLFFRDKLFDDNLDLKAGFIFHYIGSMNSYTHENGIVNVPSSNKLDFTVSGTIQKNAIVYFVWQNLLDNNYFITPYYPMPLRSIRFGIAWELFN